MADEGATPRELLIEACRRDNTELLERLIKDLGDDENKVAELVNTARDPTGLTALGVAAKYGAYEVIDLLLDQPMVETDPLARATGDTPLHLAVEYANGHTSEDGGWAQALAIVDILLDAGCDPRIRNRGGTKPADTVDGRNAELKSALSKGEMALNSGGDVVDEDEDDEVDDGHNSASDDD